MRDCFVAEFTPHSDAGLLAMTPFHCILICYQLRVMSYLIYASVTYLLIILWLLK
jgi:Na+/H+ antiporter NhaC